jgi:cysteine desulfurase
MFKINKRIYLDYAGATPTSSKILKKMSFYQKKFFSNASAIYKSGVEARKVINEAREKIALLINAHSDEIIFTGSGTESDALALLGLITNYEFQLKNEKSDYKIPHIITTKIEHPAILENCKFLEESNRVEVTYVSVNEKGIVDPQSIKEALKENTILVTVMYANNEIGTIQPIEEIAKVIRHFRKSKRTVLKRASPRTVLNENTFPVFHTDASQAMNYLFVENIEKLGVDMMTFNGSKIYGPKGVGVLYKKRGLKLNPLYHGGGQEFELRSGTENVALIAGVAWALEEVFRIKEKEVARLTKLRDYLIDELLALSISPFKIILNGDRKNRLPNNINISISLISSELLVIELDALGIEVSEKSSCHSTDLNSSHVIRAIRKTCGRKKEGESGSLRISLGQGTSKKDLDYLVSSLGKILEKYKDYKF